MIEAAGIVGRRLWTALRRHPLLGAGVAVNVVLIFFPFYDWNNLSFVIAELGGVSNTGRTLAGTSWPAGFFYLAPFSAIYVAYAASGFQIYWAVVVAKIASFGLTGASAWVLYRIGTRSSAKLGTALAAFALLNPVLLYINYVWMDWDLYPIFSLLLGYYLLRYRPLGSKDRLNLLAGSAALMVSVFFYWYALAVLPVLLVYCSNDRERVWLFAYSAVLFTALMAATVVFFVGSPMRYFVTLAGGPPYFHPLKFFGLPYYVALSTWAYVALVLAVILVLPIVLKRLRISEPAALFVVLLLFIWTSPAQFPDNYSWVFWFTPLVFVGLQQKTISWSAVGLSMAVPILGVVVASLLFTTGQADGQGIFYFGYDLFHSSYQFFPTPSSRGTLLAVWNAVTVVAVVGSLGLVLWTGWRAGRAAPSIEHGLGGASLKVGVTAPYVLPTRVRGFQSRRAIVAVVLVVALSTGALVFDLELPNVVNYQGSGPLPTLALDPNFDFISNNTPRPIPNETFSIRGSNITIFPQAPPLGFLANPQNRTLSTSLSFHLSGVVPTDAELIATPTWKLSLLTLWSVDEAGTPTLAPHSTTNVTNTTLGYPLMNADPRISLLDSTGNLSYALNSSALSSGYLFWSFQFARAGGQPVPIFEISTSGGHAGLVSYPDHASLTYGSGPPSAGGTVRSNPYTEISRQWNFVGIHEVGNQFWMDFNGVVEIVPAPWATGNATLQLGQAEGTGGPLVASNQRVSPIHVGAYGPGPTRYAFLNWSAAENGRVSEYYPTLPLELQYQAHTGPNGAQLSANGQLFVAPGPCPVMFFGKGALGNYSVFVTVHRLVIHEPSPGYFLVPAFAAVVTLYAFPVWAYRRIRAAS
jgi:hypothetical protein